MNLVHKYYADWLQHTASQAVVSGNYSLVPALLMFTVVAAVFVFTTLKIQLRYLPMLNTFLVLGTLASFQACGIKTKSQAQTGTSKGPTVAMPNPSANNLDEYFGNKKNQKPRRRLFNPTLSDLQPVVADVQQYLATSGISIQEPPSDIFEFLNSDTKVNESLKTCTGDSNHLTLDLKLDPADVKPARLAVTHGEPFIVLAYCLRYQGSTLQKVQVLDPGFLIYDIEGDPDNHYSLIEQMPEDAGWFKGTFSQFENNFISPRVSKIKLSQLQAPANETLDLKQIGYTELPSIEVLVRPNGFNAAMADYRMMTILSDAFQEPIRGGVRHGLINPATGELTIAHSDLLNPLPDQKSTLNITRTYRSFFAQVGDFGYNWDVFPKRKFFSFADVFGDDGSYEFLYSGEGRVFYIPKPEETKPGPFWSDDEVAPDPKATQFFLGKNNRSFDLQGRLLSQKDKETGNRIYYFYNGNQVALMLDWVAAKNDVSVIQNLLKQVKELNGVGKSAQDTFNAIQAKQNSAAFSNFKGKFVALIRNDKGYVVSTFDQTWNFNWYKYDGENETGDLLVEVMRFASYEPQSTAVVESKFSKPYQYNYVDQNSAPESKRFGSTWAGLLERADVKELPYPDSSGTRGILAEVSYDQDAELYAETPLVLSYKFGGTKFTNVYNFKDRVTKIQETGTGPGAGGGLNKWSRYTFDKMGLVTKTEGPTASASFDGETCYDNGGYGCVLYEGRTDIRTLRIVDQINRGIEQVAEYGEYGEPLSIKTCADRDDAGNRVVAKVPDVNEDGNLSEAPTCEGESRQVSFSGSPKYFDYFFDLAATAIMPSSTLPSANLPGGSVPLQDVAQMNGCLGTSGVHTVAGKTAGSYCTLEASKNSSGAIFGNFMIANAKETYDDGSFKLELNGQAPTGSANALAITLGTGNYPFKGFDQTGNYNWSSAAGATSIASPEMATQIQNVGFNLLRLFDPYENLVYEKYPSGAETYYDYDYRSPRPILVDARTTGIRPYSGGGTNLGNASARVFEFSQALGPDTKQNQSLAGVFWYAFNYDSAITQVKVQKTIDDNFRVVSSYDQSGNFIENKYGTNGQLEKQTVTTCAQVTPGNTLTTFSCSITRISTKEYTYYDDGRIQSEKSTITPKTGPAVSTKTYYYRDTDGGLDYVVLDQPLGAPRIESGVISYDWAGRPLISRKLVSGVTTTAYPASQTELAYNQFGEIKLKAESEGELSGDLKTGAFNPRHKVLTRYTLESNSGVVIKTSTQELGQSLGGPSVDEREKSLESQKFSANLKPTLTFDADRNITTNYNGSGGRDVTVTLNAPYVWGGADTYDHQKTRSIYNGCGSPVVLQDGSIGVLTTSIGVDYATCSSAYSWDQQMNWVVRQGYLTNGELILQDETDDRDSGTNKSYLLDNSHILNNETEANLNRSFMECPKDSKGRCNGVGWVFSLRAKGIRGFFEGDDVQKLKGFFVPSAELIVSSSLGKLYSTDFSGAKILKHSYIVYPFQSSEYQDWSGWLGLASLATTSWNRVDENLPTSSLSFLAKPGSNQWANLSSGDLDPVLGIPNLKEQYALDDTTSKVSGSVERTNYDQLGRPTSYNQYVNKNLSGGLVRGLLGETTSNLETTFTVDEWKNGKAVKTTLTKCLSSNCQRTAVYKTEHILKEGSDLVEQSTFSRREGDDFAQGKATTSYDGMSVPTSWTYYQEPPISYGGVNWSSERSVSLDDKKRITREDIKYQDDFHDLERESVIVKDQTVAREIFSNPTSYNTTYAYKKPDSTSPNPRLQMSYSSGFQAEYTLSKKSGRILGVKIYLPTDVNNPSYTFDAYPLAYDPTHPPSKIDPYPGNKDLTGGVVQLGLWDRFSSWIGSTSIDQVSLDNTEVPKYTIQGAWWGTNQDKLWRTADLGLSSGKLKKIRYPDASMAVARTNWEKFRLSGVRTGDSPEYGSNQGAVDRSRSSRLSATDPVASSGNTLIDLPNRGDSNCDNIASYTRSRAQLVNTSSGVQVVEGKRDRNSRWGKRGTITILGKNAPDRVEDDSIDRRDEKGRVMLTRRTNYEDQQIAAFDVLRSYGTSEIPERLEETIYGNTSGGQGVEIVRHTTTGRFVVTNPLPSIAGGQTSIVVEDVIRDRIWKDANGNSFFGKDLYNSSEDNAKNMSGRMVYIWGPYLGPIMAFWQPVGASTWYAYRFIYDQAGNMKTVLSVSPFQVANRYEMYWPYNSSTVLNYPRDSQYSTTVDNSGKVTRIFDTSVAADDDYKIPNSVYKSVELQRNPERRVGAGGFFRDINNMIQIGSTVYDPFTGRNLSEEKDSDAVCTGGAGQFVGEAEAIASEIDLSRKGSTEAVLSRSFESDRVAMDNISRWRTNLPDSDIRKQTYFSGDNDNNMSFTAFLNYSASRGDFWYLKEVTFDSGSNMFSAPAAAIGWLACGSGVDAAVNARAAVSEGVALSYCVPGLLGGLGKGVSLLGNGTAFSGRIAAALMAADVAVNLATFADPMMWEDGLPNSLPE